MYSLHAFSQTQHENKLAAGANLQPSSHIGTRANTFELTFQLVDP